MHRRLLLHDDYPGTAGPLKPAQQAFDGGLVSEASAIRTPKQLPVISIKFGQSPGRNVTSVRDSDVLSPRSSWGSSIRTPGTYEPQEPQEPTNLRNPRNPG